MQINRHNYEEFFLLYVDNELPVADRKAVEAFVEQNPDLEEELVMMMQSVLRPDNNIVFSNKESLLKNKPNGLVNASNYEEYFVLYGDNELTNKEKDLVEQFVYKHPQYQAEFELIQQARLVPGAIAYPDKNELYRTEEDDKVVPFRWWRIAAAAIVLLFLGVTAWYMTNTKEENNTDPIVVINDKDSNNKVKTVQPPVINNNDTRKNMAVTEDQKKLDIPRNIKRNTNVTQQSTVNDVAVKKDKVVPNIVEDTIELEKTFKTASINADVFANAMPKTDGIVKGIEPGTAMNKDEKLVYYYIDEESSEDDIKLANASISKKPVRGLIRKVKGFFEGNNDEDEPQQENKKGIRIAAFEIGLK